MKRNSAKKDVFLRKMLNFMENYFSFHPKRKSNLMKKIVTLCMALLGVAAHAQTGTGEVVGTVIDFKTKNIVFGAQVCIDDNGRLYRTRTGADGRFRIVAVPAGKHSLDVIFQGDTLKGVPVDVPLEQICNLNVIELESKVYELPVMTVKAPVKLIMGELPLKEITAADLKHNPNKFDIKTLALTTNSDVRMADDGQLMFRGARKGDMIYVLDGIKMPEVHNVPSCAISRMTVYTGGLPAKFGDTLGGAIVVETKGYFELYRAWKLANE
ncbi:MAG: hypothetical protein RL264_1928 [Bacteroidota bacterium]